MKAVSPTHHYRAYERYCSQSNRQLQLSLLVSCEDGVVWIAAHLLDGYVADTLHAFTVLRLWSRWTLSVFLSCRRRVGLRGLYLLGRESGVEGGMIVLGWHDYVSFVDDVWGRSVTFFDGFVVLL